jgi:hypothetical protein
MNERLNTIIDMAEFSEYGDLDDTYVVHRNELNKFAELVIYECIRNYRNKHHKDFMHGGRYVDEYEHSNNMLEQLGFEPRFK